MFQTALTDFAVMTDEADPEPAGVFYQKNRFGPVAYPEDRTNIPAALDQEDANGAGAVPVLNMKVTQGFIAADITALDTLLMDEVQEGSHLSGPLEHAVILFGRWSDLNEDGIIQNDQWENKELIHDLEADAGDIPGVASNALMGRASYDTSPEGDEWVGLSPDDWKEGATGRAIVVYATGEGSNTSTTRAGIAAQSVVSESSHIDGYYESLLFIGGMEPDPSLIFPLVFETFVGVKVPKTTFWCDNASTHPNGCREYDRVKPTDTDANGNFLFPSDVDVFQHLDNSLRDLYMNAFDANEDVSDLNNDTRNNGARAVDPAAAEALNDVNGTMRADPTTRMVWDDFLAIQYLDFFNPIGQIYAPPRAELDGRHYNTTVETRNRESGAIDDMKSPEQHEDPCDTSYGSLGPTNCFAYDNKTWYPFVDIQGLFGVTVPSPTFILTGGSQTNGNWNGRMPGSGNSGEAMPPEQLYIVGQVGLWRDNTTDGIIRDERLDNPDRGCPDLYDCGNTDNPNEYYMNNDGATDTAEFINLCTSFNVLVYGANAAGTQGQFTRGVYVMTEEPNTRGDSLTPIIRDATDDFQLSFTTNPVTVKMDCDPNDPGEHHPDKYIIFPTGSAEQEIVIETKTPNRGDSDGDPNTPPDAPGVCVRYNKASGSYSSGTDFECTWDVDVFSRFAT